MPASLPVERFDVRDFAPAERSEAWGEVLATTHLPWHMPVAAADPRGLAAWVQRVRVDDVSVVDCGCDPCGGTRGRTEIAATEGEFFGVLMNVAGREVLAQDGRAAELTPGEVVVWDSRRAAEFMVVEPLLKRTLFVPRDELSALCPHVDRATAIGLTRRSPAARLLVAYVATLAELAPTFDAATAVTARNTTLELLAASLRPEAVASDASVRAGLFALACERIERHLGDSRLTPASLARSAGVSLRTLQLAFADNDDTIAGFMRRRRLARAHADLTRNAKLSVTEVAFRWGFVDSGHFSRVFKKTYGVSPSAMHGPDSTGP